MMLTIQHRPLSDRPVAHELPLGCTCIASRFLTDFLPSSALVLNFRRYPVLRRAVLVRPALRVD